jgi:hypothetical protein
MALACAPRSQIQSALQRENPNPGGWGEQGQELVGQGAFQRQHAAGTIAISRQEAFPARARMESIQKCDATEIRLASGHALEMARHCLEEEHGVRTVAVPAQGVVPSCHRGQSGSQTVRSRFSLADQATGATL